MAKSRKSESPVATYRQLMAEFNTTMDQAMALIDQMAALAGQRDSPTDRVSEEELKDHVRDKANALVVRAATHFLNHYVLQYLEMEGEDEDRESKKYLVTSLNMFCKYYGVALRMPDNEDPCMIYAVGSRDGKGRYVMEHKASKKRSGAHKTIRDLLPLQLVTAPPREEGFLTSRAAGFFDFFSAPRKNKGFSG